MKNNYSLIFLITLFLILLINFFVAVSWPLYSKYKDKKHAYIDEQAELLNMTEENLNILYDETWRNYTKFTYVPFIGHSETKRIGKFLNFDQKNGRKVVRPNNCKSNVYLYGGSTMFGYNVTDETTIAQELQNLVGDQYCIYNQGRAYFYSKQENNLFAQHIENSHKIDYAIFLDGVNERCGGYEYDHHINRSFQILVERPYKMWKKTSVDFVLTLPLIQFYNSIQNKDRWITNADNNILEIESCKNNISIDKLFEKRVNLRHALCDQEKIKCFSFLQPFAGVHGKQIEKLLSKRHEKDLIKKYTSLKKNKQYVVDLGYVLNNDKTLSYIDGVHYSPLSNKKIAAGFKSFLIN
jgi:hypothetical protein